MLWRILAGALILSFVATGSIELLLMLIGLPAAIPFYTLWLGLFGTLFALTMLGLLTFYLIDEVNDARMRNKTSTLTP